MRWLEKKRGAINAFVCLILTMTGLFCLFYSNKKSLISEMQIKCEDALISSALGSALINVEEYGKNGSIVISDYNKCYSDFKACFDMNLKLDDMGNSAYTDFFASPVEVVDFRIYNVNEADGTITVLQGNGKSLISEYQTVLGSTYTPDGTLIENTSIYCRIEFDAKFTSTQSIPADKDCCVDITER